VSKLDQSIAESSRERRALAEDLGLLDANLWLGQPGFFPLAEQIDPGRLGDTLREYHLSGAMVSHWDSVRLSAQEGNRALVAADRLLPDGVWTVWTGLPLASGEPGPLPGSGPLYGRVRGVRLFPRTHNYLLAPWAIGGLCEWCTEHGLPLFVWHVETDWEQLHGLAKAFPRLTIVVDTQWQKILYHNRVLAGLLDDCANVMVESSNLIGQDFIGWMVRRWGAERILFGSFLPANDPFSAIGMILDADISLEQKALIAGGNARRLVAGVRA
jgi:hypothetical protein